jgi:amino acid transporter
MPDTHSAGTLDRSLGFWSATAINITQIVGAGVFLTVPLILKELPGWYGLLAWLVAGLLILCDGMIWAELGAAFPAAGGSYNFLRESYGRSTWGRLMSFLFVWQILISGPLEVGSGLVAAAQFSKALSPEFKEYDESRTVTKEVDVADGKTVGMSISPTRFAGFGLGVLIFVLLYRRVATLGKLSLVFLLAIFGIMAWVLFEGLLNFRSELAFAKPPPGQPESFGNGLGVAMGLAIYSYLGYYNICYLGGEVRNPTRTIPRAILASALIVIVAFVLCTLHSQA